MILAGEVRKEAVTQGIQCQWESCFLFHSTETGKNLHNIVQYKCYQVLFWVDSVK